jgi:hypothetical protein
MFITNWILWLLFGAAPLYGDLPPQVNTVQNPPAVQVGSRPTRVIRSPRR